jgi:hypothetical protein
VVKGNKISYTVSTSKSACVAKRGKTAPQPTDAGTGGLRDVDRRRDVEAACDPPRAARCMTAAHTPGHDAVLALLDWLPDDVDADAALVAGLLRIPETEAARLLAELEASGDITSATGPAQ